MSGYPPLETVGYFRSSFGTLIRASNRYVTFSHFSIDRVTICEMVKVLKGCVLKREGMVL